MESTNSGPGGADSSGEPGQTTGKSVGEAPRQAPAAQRPESAAPPRPSAYVPGRLDIKQRTLKAGDAGIDQRLLENPDRGEGWKPVCRLTAPRPNS